MNSKLKSDTAESAVGIPIVMVAIANFGGGDSNRPPGRNRYAFEYIPDRFFVLHVSWRWGSPVTKQERPQWICSGREKRKHQQASRRSRYLPVLGRLFGSRPHGKSDVHDVRVAPFGG